MKVLSCLMLASITLLFGVTAKTADLKNDPCRPADNCIRSDTQKIPAFYARFRLPISVAIAACRPAEPEACHPDGAELIDHASFVSAAGIRWLFVPVGPSGIVDQCTATMKLGFPPNLAAVGLPGGRADFIPCADRFMKNIAHNDRWRRPAIDLQQLGNQRSGI
jgi:hypothetical protein